MKGNQNLRIKYISMHDGQSGHGHAARAYMRTLIAAGIELTWLPMVHGDAWGLGYEPFLGKADEIGDAELAAFCNRELDYQVVIAHIAPDYWPRLQALEIGKPMIGYTTWETDRLPQRWPALLNVITQIMVPCQWNQKVFREAGVGVPINVIPHLLPDSGSGDNLEESPQMDGHESSHQAGKHIGNLQAGHPLCGIHEDDFVFYSIGACTPHKNIWATVAAYLDAFSADDAVVLVVKTTRHDFSRRRWLRGGYTHSRDILRKMLAKHRRPARILLIDRECDEATMAALHERGDGYISLCHSEGWGLGAFAAAGRGKPVIITAYGGQLDYLPHHLCYPVRYTLGAVRIDGHPPQPHDQHWALPDQQHAMELLREVFSVRDEARARGRKLQHFVQENFATDKTITHMMKCIASTQEVGALPTLVSAYYEVDVFVKGGVARTRGYYQKWLQHFALIDNPLIFFVANEEDRELIERVRCGQRQQTQVLVVAKENLATFQNINTVKSSIARADFELGHPNTSCAEYSLLMHSKYEFIGRAIGQNLIKTQAVAWMDCGRIFETLALKPQKRYVVRQGELDLNKIHFSEAASFDPSCSLRKIQIEHGGHGKYWLAGAFFIGGVEIMQQFTKRYLHQAHHYQEQGYIFTDQVQLTAMRLEGDMEEIVPHFFYEPWFGMCASLLVESPPATVANPVTELPIAISEQITVPLKGANNLF